MGHINLNMVYTFLSTGIAKHLLLVWLTTWSPVMSIHYYLFANGTESHIAFRECGDTQGSQLAGQLAFIIAIIIWVGLCSLGMFGLLKVLGILRVSAEVEEGGLDTTEHGGGAYSGATRKPSFRSPTKAEDLEAELDAA